jgi:hypothetical protein
MKVFINNGSGNVDYTRYVVDGSLNIEDSVNVPTLISFQLSNIDQLFVVPRRSSYVTVQSEIYLDSSSGISNTPISNITVTGTDQPWVITGGLNSGYSYNSGGTGTSPASISVVAGQTYTLNYVSGTVSRKSGTYGFYGPTGDPTNPGPSSPQTSGWPGFWCAPNTCNAGCCIGAWADSSGNLVSAPFAVGNNFVGTAPGGATQLLLGINDTILFSDNVGSWVFSVGVVAFKILATGFITTEPERTYLGLSQGTKSTSKIATVQNQVYTYNINVTSDEWLLNVKTVPYIPAFVNQTDSQILANIATALAPGFFNTTLMASGTLVPYFAYDPSQTWSDVAKTFADANRYHYKVINKQIIYQPFGDKPLGIAYDDTTQKEKSLSPLELKTSLVTVPPVNDCIVIGDVEPQTNWDNYFIGDGFTSNFQLKHQVFQGTSSELLSDDWTESSFTQGTWTVNDPLGVCILADGNGNAVGALNVIQKGSVGVYTPQNLATYIQAQNGLELGGGINLQHGQIIFNDTASGGGGIIGGIYGTSTFLPGNCLAGFGITGQQGFGPVNIYDVETLPTSSTVNLTYIRFLASSINGACLLGAWTDNTGQLKALPFLVGIGIQATVPAGVTKLSLGVNDWQYGNNSGSWVISVNGSNVTVQSTTAPWNLGGSLNSAYPFNNAGTTAPITVNVTPGQTITINYVSGTVSLGPGHPSVDSNGDATDIPATGIEARPGNFAAITYSAIVQSLGPWVPGYVIKGTGFAAAASIMNGKSFTITAINPTTGIITVVGLQTYSSHYGPTADSGTVSSSVNDVLVTASGAAGIVVQPILNGQYVGTQVVSQINHQYVLQTWIGANTQSRYIRPYGNLTQTKYYGNQNLAASGAITFVITDVNLGNYVIEQLNPLFGLFPSAPPPVVTQYTKTNVTLPPFALYCLINGIDLNVSINYTVLSEPPQGFLTVQSLTGMSGGNNPWLPSQLSTPVVYQLGFGMINQTAQISQSGEAYELSFYTDTIPSVGARIRFLSWSAGQSVARVRDTVAVAAEAAISGDDGVRSAIMQNLSPLPRTSDECEAAAAAAILDREYPQFQGSYTVVTVPFRYESLFSPSLYDYPKSGEFFYVNSLVRGVTGQNFFVNTARISVVELKQEVLNISIDYGPDLYLERLLPSFLEREQNILVPTQTVSPPSYITLPQVLNAHLATLDNAQITAIVDSTTGNYVTVDLGSAPVTGCEVRNVDSGWGTQSQGRVGLFTTQTFNLTRTSRDQTWYLRTLNGSQFSRFSKALRVVYPLVPTAPTLVQADTTKAVFDYAGDVRDIYGLELRAFPISGELFFVGTPTVEDNLTQYVRTAVVVGPTIQSNVIAVYDPPSYTNPFPYSTQLGVGDIIYTTCANDNTFQGIEIISQVIAATQPTNPFYPASVTLNSANAYLYYNTSSNNGFQRTYPTLTSQAVASYANLQSLQFNSFNLNRGTDPWYQPMQVDTYDTNGMFHGYSTVAAIATQGYDMIITGSLFFPSGGNWTFVVNHDDAFLFGIQGATRVLGPQINPIGQTHTAVLNLPILGANNQAGNYQNETYIVSVPVSGNYNFEIDYTQWKDNQTLVVFAGSSFSKAQGIYPTPPGIGLGGSNGTPWEFGWFDYGQVTPDIQGQYVFGVDNVVGTVQQIQTGNYSFVASGSISGNYQGICTVLTQTPHGFNIGNTAIIGCGWSSWPATLPTPPNSGAVFCGQQVVTNVLSVTGFQFIISRFTTPAALAQGSWEQVIAATGVNFQQIQGVCSLMPTPQNLTLASGVILQRPVFAPSDLVIDFTQPDIAETLEIIQALSPNNRVGSLRAFFYNTQWDYSLPTTIPAFDVPMLVNIVIDGNTQQVEWQVQQGSPKGYRVEINDVVTGQTYNRFTVDNPLNPQGIKQFKINPLDFANTRTIVVTPFDALGDGIPVIITNASSYSISGSQSPGSYSIGCTYDGPIPISFVLIRIPLDVPIQFGTNFNLSQAYLETAPTSLFVCNIYQILAGGAPASAFLVGTITFNAGSRIATFSGGPINFSAGDIIKVVTPATADATASDIGIVLSAIKN